MNRTTTRHVALALLFCLARAGSSLAGETLYNGIRLPAAWPPQRPTLSLEAQPPWYLQALPKVIPIDVGRQLFFDDFLIAETSLTRTFHRPAYDKNNPILKPDQPWEHLQDGDHQGPVAMPFSDGVWYDPRDRLFKMWYHADYGKAYLCYATSKDGLHWEKPRLDVAPGTNIVLQDAGASRVVWLDLEEKDPSRRFKLITTGDGSDLILPDQQWFGTKSSMHTRFSPDGIHWGAPVARTGPTGDRNTAFWNPFRQRWVFSLREYLPIGGLKYPVRCRRYWESPDLIKNLPWKYREAPLWVGADDLDRSAGYRQQPELYNLDAVAYESVLLGMFSIMRRSPDRSQHVPKVNEVCVGFSRDGFHWDRPDRRSFLPASGKKDSWNRGNVQSVGGGCLVVGDKLYFYASGRQGTPDFFSAGCSTGLAVLRRDGFASMDAGDDGGTLTTRPIQFSGRYLFVNLAAAEGQLRAEVLDAAGHPIAPFTQENCIPVQADSTLAAVRWKGASDLSAVAGQPVKFRFYVKQGQFYSFWVSPDPSGASHGYVAGGGPGFTTNSDTVGSAAYRQ